MRSTSLRAGRSVVVTGAGAGLGRDIALALAAGGYFVFGTAASAAEARDLKDASGGRISLTVCEMTKATSVEAWACGVTDALGDAGLDLLINNASILTQGPIEILQLDDIRHEFDCNVFAVISVTNAFLPASGARTDRADQFVDGKLATALQRAIGSLPCSDGGVFGGLPRRIEALRHRCRGGVHRQHVDGCRSGDRSSRADRGRDDGRATQTLRQDVRRLRQQVGQRVETLTPTRLFASSLMS